MNGFLHAESKGVIRGKICHQLRTYWVVLHTDSTLEYFNREGVSKRKMKPDCNRQSRRESSHDRKEQYCFSYPNLDGLTLLYASSEAQAEAWISCLNGITHYNSCLDNLQSSVNVGVLSLKSDEDKIPKLFRQYGSVNLTPCNRRG